MLTSGIQSHLQTLRALAKAKEINMLPARAYYTMHGLPPHIVDQQVNDILEELEEDEHDDVICFDPLSQVYVYINDLSNGQVLSLIDGMKSLLGVS